MTELFLEGHKIDILDELVTQTLQINNLAELKDRQANYTNRFKVPLTASNVKVFDFLGITGNKSRKPYEQILAKLVVDGIELISDGEAKIKKTVTKNGGYYDINIYYGSVTLHSAIKDKTLKDLDFSEYNHAFTIQNIINSFSNDAGYIYGIANFNTETIRGAYGAANFEVKYKEMQISFFMHSIFSRIMEEINVVYSGDIFSDNTYLEKVVTIETANIGSTVNASALLPKINQYTFIKNVMQMFGLVFRKHKNLNHYEFIKIEDQFNDRNNAEDWSKLLVEKVEESYSIGNYAQKNIFKYKYGNGAVETHNSQFIIDNINLKNEKIIFTSLYQISAINSIINSELIYDVKAFKENGEPSKITPRILTVEKKSYTIDFTEIVLNNNISQTNVVRTHIGDIPFLTLERLNFNHFIKNYYSSLATTINRGKKIIATFLLSAIDIYNVDFFKLKYISQFGSYFYLNKISNFNNNNKATKCELIEVFKDALIDTGSVGVGGATEFKPPVAVISNYLSSISPLSEILTDTFYSLWSFGPSEAKGWFNTHLYGRLSYDPQDLPLTFEWRVISAPSGFVSRISDFLNMNEENSNIRFHSFGPSSLRGIYVIRLTVVNSAGLTGTRDANVIVT